MRLVGNQGPTLHIVKSDHDYLFGGFAFEKYPSNHNEDKEDSKAFLFQLHPKQVKLTNKQDESYKKKAIRCFSSYLSLFGENDMHICDKPSGSKSTANLGSTYE